MPNGWIGGRCCDFPDVGAWIPEAGRAESRGRGIILKWQLGGRMPPGRTSSRGGVKDSDAVPPGLWQTPHGGANHEGNLP
jgi:hypothetical protein